MRLIKKNYKAVYGPVADLITYRALPTRNIEYIDPFLFLNHHGPQVYSKNNSGLPFGPHPHRGIETVTFIINGDIVHKDNSGNESVIYSGGIQWMRAGKGLIHSEVSSREFLDKGGPLEILQLWVNLPAKLKMSEPFYKGLQKEEIPKVILDEESVVIDVISGGWMNKKGAFQSEIGLQLFLIKFSAKGKLTFNIPKDNNILFYVIRGKLNVNNNIVEALHLAEFSNNSEEIEIEAESESILMLGYAKPLNEPIVAHGPFVMNSEEEIKEAYDEYRNGKFGTWNE
ncbi:MAG TPA: pirin family protein [Ignavibacteriaceae bacterium]|nr:pirin family protein [Ignavibacteriaceae bacterium]